MTVPASRAATRAYFRQPLSYPTTPAAEDAGNSKGHNACTVRLRWSHILAAAGYSTCVLCATSSNPAAMRTLVAAITAGGPSHGPLSCTRSMFGRQLPAHFRPSVAMPTSRRCLLCICCQLKVRTLALYYYFYWSMGPSSVISRCCCSRPPVYIFSLKSYSDRITCRSWASQAKMRF